MPDGPPSVVGMMQVSYAARGYFVLVPCLIPKLRAGSRDLGTARSHTRTRVTAVPTIRLTRHAS